MTVKTQPAFFGVGDEELPKTLPEPLSDAAHTTSSAQSGMTPLDGAWLLSPVRLWSRDDLEHAHLPPSSSGVYGWYFDALPPTVPTAGCATAGSFTLAYVGISPKAPPRNGALPSSQTLRSRIRYHFGGNAEGSTLRLTLGCLLSEELGLDLRRVGSGTRMTFHEGEERLSEWMRAHARVAFTTCAEPWITEEQLIASLSLPLNLAGNERHLFHPSLTALRREHKERARMRPIL
jgi:hypothetical protein